MRQRLLGTREILNPEQRPVALRTYPQRRASRKFTLILRPSIAQRREDQAWLDLFVRDFLLIFEAVIEDAA